MIKAVGKALVASLKNTTKMLSTKQQNDLTGKEFQNDSAELS